MTLYSSCMVPDAVPSSQLGIQTYDQPLVFIIKLTLQGMSRISIVRGKDKEKAAFLQSLQVPGRVWDQGIG